jgi:predicted TIM-barrel fold metal-dependent hydrolase
LLNNIMRPAVSTRALTIAFLLVSSSACGFVQPARQGQGASPGPIIDMHLHALNVADFGLGPAVCGDNRGIEWNGWDSRAVFDLGQAGTCKGPSWPAPKDDAELLRVTLATLNRFDIRAVTSGPWIEVVKWHAAAPARIVPAASFFAGGTDSLGRPRMRDLAELRRLVREKQILVFAEITQQYRGMRPDDPALDPYFALAEELDVPVGIHMGEGPPGGANVEGYEQYRVSLGNPLLLEPVLLRHPHLRVYVMHYGSPFVDDMIALLFSYPQVYVDIAQNDWGFPRAHFYAQLKRLVDAGFGRRIMFGSDQMIWPRTIDLAIETLTDAPFLSATQKRDILYNNAARFLRLTSTSGDTR